MVVALNQFFEGFEQEKVIKMYNWWVNFSLEMSNDPQETALVSFVFDEASSSKKSIQWDDTESNYTF